MTLMPETYANQTFIMNLQESAHELRCSPRTLLRAIEQGQIRAKKIRGRWLFSRKAVIAYGLGFGPRLSAAERKELQDLIG